MKKSNAKNDMWGKRSIGELWDYYKISKSQLDPTSEKGKEIEAYFKYLIESFPFEIFNLSYCPDTEMPEHEQFDAKINLLPENKKFDFVHKEIAQITDEILNIDAEFIFLLNDLPEIHQIDIENIKKETILKHIVGFILSPVDVEKYIEFWKGHRQGEFYANGLDLPRYNKIVNFMRKLEHLRYMKNIDNPLKENTITGFKTILTVQQRAGLYKALQNKYIDCSEAEFKAMFTDSPKPIKWIERKVLLSFFVSDLFQKKNPDNYWKKAESIFIDEYEKPMKELRQSFYNAFNNKSQEPKEFNKLKDIYTPLL